MQHDLVFVSWGKEGRKNDILPDMQKWCQTLHRPYYITASYIPPLIGTEEALGLRDHSLDKFQQDLTVNGSWGMLRLSIRNAKRLAPNSTQVLKRPLHCLHIDAHRLFLASAWKPFGILFSSLQPYSFPLLHPAVLKPRIQIFAVFIGAFSSLSGL